MLIPRILRVPLGLLAASVLAAGCVTTASPRRSELQEKAAAGSASAAELRTRVYEAAERLGGILEVAADEVRSKSSDPTVRRRALRWKADGILALYAAAFRPDPFMGALDLWVLVEQMDFFFADGDGESFFGAEQPIARAAIQQMLALCDEVATAVAGSPASLDRWRTEVQEFARAHPVQGAFSTRSTAASELARFLGQENSGAFAAVGKATETLSDITLRLDSYSTLMPKEMRWQGELLIGEVLGRENLGATLDDIDALGGAGKRIDEVLSTLPEMGRAAIVPIRELIDQEREDLLGAVDRQIVAMTGFIASERQAALDAVRAEREAAFESLSRERAAALAEIDAISKRSVDAAGQRARDVVDHLFWRILVLLVAATVLAVSGYRLATASRRSS
jgi:hypothetical protein